jgi:hypothetical protein
MTARINFKRLFRYRGESAYNYYMRKCHAVCDEAKWWALGALFVGAIVAEITYPIWGT